jgi:hypothetical protein
MKEFSTIVTPLALLQLSFAYAGGQPHSSTTESLSNTIVFVAGSTQKVCQLSGERDRQFSVPTLSQTEKRYGLVGTDRGYSFEHIGKLFLLFGDSQPSSTFNGHPNGQTNPPRTPLDNDAIAYTASSWQGIPSRRARWFWRSELGTRSQHQTRNMKTVVVGSQNMYDKGTNYWRVLCDFA